MAREHLRIRYPGGKGLAFRHLINLMPPHRRYVETHLGSGAVFRNKRPARSSIGIEMDPRVVARWRAGGYGGGLRVLQGDAALLLPGLSLGPDDLVYCDPPYHPDTRRRRRCYRYDCDGAAHGRLLAVLLELRCAVVLSGYANALYDAVLAGWTRTDYTVLTHDGQVVESAWTNFEPGAPLHDYSHVGGDFRERERFRRRSASLARRIAGTSPVEVHAALAALADTHPEAVLQAAARIADPPGVAAGRPGGNRPHPLTHARAPGVTQRETAVEAERTGC